MKKKLVLPLLACLCIGINAQAADIEITLDKTYDLSELFPDAASVENEDGTITYTLTDEQQEEGKKYYKEGMDETTQEYLSDDENYPALTDLKYNDDMTEFEMYVDPSIETNMEGMIPFTLMFIAPVYQQMDGVSADDVDFTFKTIDAETKEEISSGTFKEMIEDMQNSSTAPSTESESDSAGENVEKILFDTDSAKLEYTDFEFMDHEQGKLIVLKYNFTNKTEQPSMVSSFFNSKVYQNGMELTPYMGMGNSACDNTYKTSLKDTEVEIGMAYMLQDTENPVVIYMYNGYVNPECQIQELKIAE